MLEYKNIVIGYDKVVKIKDIEHSITYEKDLAKRKQYIVLGVSFYIENEKLYIVINTEKEKQWKEYL